MRASRGCGCSRGSITPSPSWAGFVYLDELKATTDRDGRFTLEGMPEGVTCDFVAEDRTAVRRRALSASDESKNVVTLLGAVRSAGGSSTRWAIP